MKIGNHKTIDLESVDLKYYELKRPLFNRADRRLYARELARVTKLVKEYINFRWDQRGFDSWVKEIRRNHKLVFVDTESIAKFLAEFKYPT